MNSTTPPRTRSALALSHPSKRSSRDPPRMASKPVEKMTKGKPTPAGAGARFPSGDFNPIVGDVNSKTHVPSAGFEPVHERYFRAREAKRTCWSGLTTTANSAISDYGNMSLELIYILFVQALLMFSNRDFEVQYSHELVSSKPTK